MSNKIINKCNLAVCVRVYLWVNGVGELLCKYLCLTKCHNDDTPTDYKLFHMIYVSESDILSPIDYLSNIEHLVLFERAMFEDCSFK